MAGLMDLLVSKRRARGYASGGYVMPAAATKFQQAQDTAERDAQVRAGAFSTVPPPLATIDESRAGQIPPGAVTPDQVQVQEAGTLPRLLEAGSADLTGGVKNAIAATAQVVGADNVAGAMRRSAQNDAARAAQLTQDQINDIHDVHSAADLAKFGFGQAVRGLPTLGAMALGGGLARAAGAPALAGVAIPSLALNTGAAYQQANNTVDQQVASGQMTPEQAAAARAGSGKAAFEGGAAGALVDTLAFGYASKLAPFAKGLLASTVAKSLPGHVLRTLGVEGLTGAARQYANDVAVKTLLNDPNAFGLAPDDIQGLESAAAQNAAATAPLALPGHFGGAIRRGAQLVGTGLDKTAQLAGRAYQAARPAVDSTVQQAVETAQPHVQGAMDKFADLAQSAQQVAQPFVDRAKQAVGDQAAALAAGLRKMADAAKAPEQEGAPQQSLAGRLSPDVRTIRDALGSSSPNATLLAKRLEQMITRSPAEFEGYIRQPVVAGLIEAHFGETPEQFSSRVLEPLRAMDREKPESQTPLWDALQRPTETRSGPEPGLEDQARQALGGIDAEDGEALKNLDTSDVLNAVNSPNEGGVRRSDMTPDVFAKALPTDRQVKAGSKAGGNAWVIVKRETKDPDTGAVVSTDEQPKQVNFINLSKAWADQREPSEKEAMFGASTQAKFDANFKDGLSAMLNGWHETDAEGRPVDVTVQPARQHTESGTVAAVPREDMQGWLRPDSVVGNSGEPRTFSQVEEAGRANAPVDVPSAIEQYHERVANASPERKQLVQAREAGNVARMAVERIKDGIETLEPERQQDVIQASIDYASDPTQRPIPKDVPSYLRMLPAEILEHGKARLVSDLSDLDLKVVQPRQRTEQESSVDNPMHNDEEATTKPEPRVTEDVAGQHIDYAATERAGRKALQSDTTSAQVSADRNNVEELKRRYAEATTAPGKAIARKALEAALPKARPAQRPANP